MTASAAAATLVMSWRERHGLTLRALDNLDRHTPPGYRLLVLDFAMPAALSAAVRRQAPAAEIVPIGAGVSPTEARGRVAGGLDTPYAVFLDNDVTVHAGWLEALLDCAETTGAGIVSPLVLIGDGAKPGRVHFAGGDLHTRAGPAGTVMEESHRLADRDLAEVGAQLVRAPCDFAEFHCLLMRREVYTAPQVFDPRIHCVHEHIHAALCARRLGYPVWVEPAARVTYLAGEAFPLAELPGFRRRWDRQAAERSIAAFCDTWQMPDDARSFGGVRAFLGQHSARVDPLRPGAAGRSEAGAAMPESALRQTLTGLLDLAAERGYSADDLRAIRRAGWEVLVLMDGGYRPCGRPFVNHLAGCASVLVHYGFALPLVLAALHHSTYTHFPAHGPGTPGRWARSARAAGRQAADGIPIPLSRPASLAEHLAGLCAQAMAPAASKRWRRSLAQAAARALGGRGSPLEREVRAYSLRKHAWSARPSGILDIASFVH